MRPQPLRPFLSPPEQARELLEVPYEPFADSYQAVAMMRRANADLRQVIQTSVVCIAEAQETLKQANAVLARRDLPPAWKGLLHEDPT